ncbi:hypothetical protein [Polyangium sp. 15x6]|uniref:hypothetical protein n=1 Tax=Polyangium sp. 15x6 TaxID=3042687 RepID=UPI00249C7680|nr:hypothetical protein [Polyangium sp. 15x6]MDI3287179.1 hypothetical protein [Polyangium sp. 15x6]
MYGASIGIVLGFASLSMLNGGVAGPPSDSLESSAASAHAVTRAETTYARSPADPLDAFPAWTWCANEYRYCGFRGTRRVAYGRYPTFVYRWLTDGAACNNDTFGDPLIGVDKVCYLLP